MISAMVFHAQPESVSDDAAQPRGFRIASMASVRWNPPCFMTFILTMSAAPAPITVIRLRVVENRFVRHDGNAARFAAHPRHHGEIAGRDRLLEELQVIGLGKKCARRIAVSAS